MGVCTPLEEMMVVGGGGGPGGVRGLAIVREEG